MPVLTLASTKKIGSTWRFVLTRKYVDDSPVILSGLVVRSMFRQGTAVGPLITALSVGAGLTVEESLGKVTLEVSATNSAKFANNVWVYFDVEMTNIHTGHVWQSDTYRFKTEPEVTSNG